MLMRPAQVKDYFMNNRMNRFNNPEQAKKNRILPPTKVVLPSSCSCILLLFPTQVVHFYGIRKMTESEVADLFERLGAPKPNKVKVGMMTPLK